MPKRTYQPSKIKRQRKFGFRNKSPKILSAKRAKGRKKLSY